MAPGTKKTSVCVNRASGALAHPEAIWDIEKDSLVAPAGGAPISRIDRRKLVPGELSVLDRDLATGEARSTRSNIRLFRLAYSGDFEPFWKGSGGYPVLWSILAGGFRPGFVPGPSDTFAAVVNPKTNRCVIISPGTYTFSGGKARCISDSYPMARIFSDESIITDETQEMNPYCLSISLEMESDLVLDGGMPRIIAAEKPGKNKDGHLEESLNDLRVRLVETSERYEEASADVRRLETLVSTYAADNLRLTQENDRLKRRMEQSEAGLRTLLESAESEVSGLRAELSQKESRISELASEADSLRASLEFSEKSRRNGAPTGTAVRRISENEMESKFFRPGNYSVRIAADRSFIVFCPDPEGIACDGRILRFSHLNEKVPFEGPADYDTYSVPNGGLKIMLRRSVQGLRRSAVHQIVQYFPEIPFCFRRQQIGVLAYILLEDGGSMPFFAPDVELLPVRMREYAFYVIETGVYV